MPASFSAFDFIRRAMVGMGILPEPDSAIRVLPQRTYFQIGVTGIAPGASGASGADTVTGEALICPNDEIWVLESVGGNHNSNVVGSGGILRILPNEAPGGQAQTVAFSRQGASGNLIDQEWEPLGKRFILEPGDQLSMRYTADAAQVGNTNCSCNGFFYRYPRGMAPWIS